MTIKISQLGTVAAVQGNALIPMVSNITGTQTTVKANVEQLQTYVLENAGNIIPSASNVYSIGNSTTWWKDLWLSANTLYIGGVPIGTSGGQLTFGGNAVGTSGLDTYTGNVSASNIAVGSTTVGNTTTAPTFSVEGSTGNITAGNITAGNISSTGDLGAASVSTPTMTSNTIKIGYGGFSIIQGAVASITMTNAGLGLFGRGGYVQPLSGGTGTGLTIVIKQVSVTGAITEWDVYNPGEGYTPGDTLTFGGGLPGETPAQFTIDATNDSGTMTAGSSTWTYDPSGDTTLPGNITLPDNTAIYNENASTAVFTSNSITDNTGLSLTDSGNAAVYASDYIILETNSDGNVARQWAFNNNGNVVFPDNTTQSTAFSNTAPIITTIIANSATQSDLINGINANVTAANVGMIGYVGTQVNIANVGMKGYVDSQITQVGGSSYGNANVAQFLPTYSGNVGSLLNLGNFTTLGNITAGFAAPVVNYANVIFLGTGVANGYSQLNIQNIDSVGTQNSSDFIATAPNGTDSTRYIDMGINGNNYSSSSWTVSGPNDGYVYINSGNLTLGTDTVGTTVKVHVGGTLSANVVTTFSNSNVTISGNLIVSNSYVPTANNSVGTKGQISYDSSYVYVCIADNTWRRANLAIW